MAKNLLISHPNLDGAELALINRLLAQLRSVTTRNTLRASYYDGKRALKQVGSVIPPQYFRLGLVLGWAAKAVDIPASRVNPEEVVWPDGNLSRVHADEVLNANDFYTELRQALVSSMIYGCSFLIVTEGDTEVGEPKALMHVKDALNATGDWNPRTRHMDNLLSITAWGKDGLPTGLVLYQDGLTISCDLLPDGTWSVIRQEHDWGVPVERVAYRPRPDRPFGSSRISRPVMSLHDQALRTVIRLEGHMDIYSYPELWMLGADESIFKDGQGRTKPTWQVMMGRLKGIPDDPDVEGSLARADVKQFPASDPTPQLMALKQQAQLFSGETCIPLSSLGVSDMANPTSADSYVASREDLIAEIETAIEDWSGPARRTLVRLLQVANGQASLPASWSSIDLKWRNPLHQSKAAVADAGMKTLAAAPWLADTEVGLELLGLTKQQIERAQGERAQAAAQATITAAVVQNPDLAQLGVQVPVNPAASDATAMKAKFDALGVAIRSGVDPQNAAAQLGLDGIQFTGAMPTSLRLPEADAAHLEQA